MTSQTTAQNAPFSRFTRGAFAFPSRHEPKKKSVDKDEWYIPYNGPYELPRGPPRQEKARDSWGDALDEFDEGGVLGDKELQIRYGGDFQLRHSNGRLAEEEQKGRPRDRSFSVHSTRTTSSGAMDPSRGSLTMNRRSTVSAARPPLPSYVNIDTMGGGVGESPMPHPRSSKDTHRISIASIFSFAGSHRKSVASPAPEQMRSSTTPKSSRFQRGSTLLQEKDTGYGKLDVRVYASGSLAAQPKSGTKNKQQRLHENIQARDERIDSSVTDADNSYYQSLAHQSDHDRTKLLSPTYQPRSPTASSDSRSSSNSQQNSTSTTSGYRHPYAQAFPTLTIPPVPQSVPPSTSPQQSTFNNGNPPRLTFTTAGPSRAGPSTYAPGGSGSKGLKNSTSTPNLRSPVASLLSRPASDENGAANATTATATPKFSFPKGKERWLSAETWCDALLFPRPRLRIKQEIIQALEQQKQAGATVSTGRIVSPPVTPTDQRDFESQQQREPGIASRVLAHSRSLVDLSLNKGKKKENAPQRSILRPPQISTVAGKTLRPPRPKSFALDDLALPSPVPSLAQYVFLYCDVKLFLIFYYFCSVLREGAMLDTERKAWQRQAQTSFGNKHSRTISRTRSKSLTQKGHKPGHQHQSSFEFIAAQACLGTQNYSPGIPPPRLAYFSDGTSATTSRGTHSHSNSLVKTLSKSTKSHSRTHSRNDSWSKSAMKMVAKPAVLAPFSSSDAPAASSSHGQQPHHKTADLEGALKGQGTRVIRLADPAHLPLDRGANTSGNGLSPRQTPSPAFSAMSDSRVGIALGTPPEEESANYIPHPYANGGLSFNAAPRAEQSTANFAGPHRSVNTSASKVPPISDILARHKLPPHIVLHPYAQTSNRDSYLSANGLVGQYRSGDRTPHEAKMWAQLSPSDGVVHEVLPDDLEYSPSLPDASSARSPNRHTMNIRDTVGLGETLVNAVNATRFRRASPDSGVGTSESHGYGQQMFVQRQQSDQQEFQSRLQVNTSAPEVRIERGGINQSTSDQILRSHSNFASNHTLASSGHLPVPSPEHQTRHPSPSTTDSYSPQTSPRLVGSPHDLESFHDLFFRPSASSAPRTPNEAALPESPSPPLRTSLPWDVSMRTRRTDSSLTNLARQLSDEFEQMGLERERELERGSTLYTGSVASSLRAGGLARRPTEGSLQFLFEEVVALSASPPEDTMDDTIHAFKATETLPEDVLSSRASSFIEANEDDDPTGE